MKGIDLVIFRQVYEAFRGNLAGHSQLLLNLDRAGAFEPDEDLVEAAKSRLMQDAIGIYNRGKKEDGLWTQQSFSTMAIDPQTGKKDRGWRPLDVMTLQEKVYVYNAEYRKFGGQYSKLKRIYDLGEEQHGVEFTRGLDYPLPPPPPGDFVVDHDDDDELCDA